MDDEYEWSDAACPKCRHSPTHMRTCTSLGCDDGCFDEYEDDPINAMPGEFSICAECSGTGIEHWCPKCGHDMNTTANVRSQATDAALSRQVACTDGLCGNGSEVGAGDTAMKGKQ